MDDIVLNKTAIIERCIKRIEEEYQNNPKNLENYTKQDSIILNIQRACEAAIDLAMYLVSKNKLGLPQKSREAFELLADHQIIETQLKDNLVAMVGSRNIAVHNYQDVNLKIIERIIERHLKDLLEFKTEIVSIYS